jgi:UrcA family protein
MMNTTTIRFTMSLAFALAGFFVTANLAIAQQLTEEIVVLAPIERPDIQDPVKSGAKTELIELNRVVSFADLDLRNQEDVAILDTRIANVAAESCQKLSDMFPLDRSNPAERDRCTNIAIAGANKQIELAISRMN